MSRYVRFSCLILVGVCVSATCEAQTSQPAQQLCVPMSIGLDTTQANTSRSPFLGKALGQSFEAEDTVITMITIWRWRGDRSAVGAHLFVTAVDTTLSPPRPDTRQVLLDGPTVLVYDSSPPGNFVQMDFVLNPPLILPRRGLYAWFLQADACNGGAVWNIAGNNADPYPFGNYWITGRVISSCYLRDVSGGEIGTDLLFRIEYCVPSQTPTRRQSWGNLKLIYH